MGRDEIRGWWWLTVTLVTSAMSVMSAAACSSSDGGVQYCKSSDECGDGMVCGTEACSGLLTCIRAECACIPPDGFRNVCSISHGPACSCDAATCSHPLDSCGKRACLGVCNIGESCQFCLEGDACAGAEPCLGSSCVLGPTGQAACRPDECIDVALEPPLCGTVDAPCGEACTVPNCAGFECGDDDLTGLSCGDCGAHRYCDINRKCVEPPQYLRCTGDLQAQPTEIQVDVLHGPMPAPSGGSIADGTYDLVAERASQAPLLLDIYTRGAMRFFDAGTHVEHIYDPVLGSQADPDSPHRFMNVTSSGSELTFDVTCPDPSSIIFPHYVRGYTANGSELWLFQQQLIEIYAKRP